MSSSPQTTTQTVTSLPPAYIQPQMETIAADARNLYANNVGPRYFPDSTTIPFNPMTQEAFQGAADSARNNPLNQQAFSSVNGIMQNNGVAGGTQQPLNQLGGIASGYNNINTGNQYQGLIDNAGGVSGAANPSLGTLGNISSGLDGVGTGRDYGLLGRGVPVGGLASGTQSPLDTLGGVADGGNRIRTGQEYARMRNGIGDGGLAQGTTGSLNTMGDYASGLYGIGTEEDYRNELNRTGGQTAAEQYLSGMAGGANVGGNPFLKSQIENSNRQIQDQINSGMSGAGRYGSGAHTGVLADKLSQNTNTALFNQYNQDVQNQLASTGLIDSSRNAQEAQRQGLLSGITGVQGQNVQNQLGAAQNLFSNLQGAQNQGFQQHLSALAGQTGAENQNIVNQSNAANSLFGNLQGAQNQGFQQQMGALAGQTGVETNNLAARAAASNNLSNFYQNAQNQGFANQLQGLQGLSGVQGANIANQGNTSQTMANIYQNAQDQALKASLASPALADTRFNDYSRLADIGGQYEAKQGEELKDQIARYEFQNMQPWNQLGLLSGAVQGINTGGTQTSVTQRPDLPLGQRLLGGAAVGGGLGGMLGMGPLGVLGGAAGGGLLGAFA